MSLADITSANVVGYSQVTIPAQQYTMIGIQFSAVDGQDIDIQDLFADPLGQGLVGIGTPNSAGLADQLFYWDPNESGNYVKLYLNNNQSQSARYNKWCTEAIPADKSWGTAKNQASTKKIKSGMGLWLFRPASACTQPITLTMAGAVVVAQEGRTYNVHEGYNMISGGFTTGFAPNPDVAGVGKAIDWLSLGFKGIGTPNSAGLADQLFYWDPNESGNYVKLYLNNNQSQSARYNKWCTEAIPADKSWGTAKNQASPKVMPMGRGLWLFRPSGAGDLTFTLPQPYTLQ